MESTHWGQVGGLSERSDDRLVADLILDTKTTVSIILIRNGEFSAADDEAHRTIYYFDLSQV